MAEASPPTLSVIIPTVSRETLTRTLESIAAQELIPGDEVLIVQDGPADPAVREPIRAAGWPWKYLATGKRANDFGAAPRNHGMQHARGDFLLFVDDDDMYRTGDTSPSFYRHDGPGAFAAIRRAIARHPGRPLMFRMEPRGGPRIWRMMAVRFGNVAGPMFVVPNQPDKLGTWPAHRASDFGFICETLRLWPPGSVVWDPTIIASVPQPASPAVDEVPLTRNLIYHVFAYTRNNVWRENVERLTRSWHLFTGRKIIGIVTDGSTAPVEQVQAAFPADPAIEWLIAPNDPKTGETVTFLSAAERLRSYNPDEVTFYAHVKGVSQRVHDLGETAVTSVRRWVDYMYRHCLEIPPERIDRALRDYACAGSLRWTGVKQGKPPDLPCYWHYSGTFFWYNHARFYSDDRALRLGGGRHALERHLGQVFPVDEAHCFAGDFDGGNMYARPAEEWAALEPSRNQNRKVTFGNTTLRVGTCITENYLDRAASCLRSLPNCGADPFVVAYGFHPDERARQAFSGLQWHHLPAGQPADCDGCVQYGAWLDALPHDPGDVLVMADADAVFQRGLDPGELAMLESLGPDEVAVGPNAGEQDTLQREAARLRRGSHEPMDQTLDGLYPGFSALPCYNVGFLAARASWWPRLRAAFVQAWPEFNRLFTHRARCQWLTCWLIHAMGSTVKVLPYSIHAHGHFGLPPGCNRNEPGGNILFGDRPVFFAHHFSDDRDPIEAAGMECFG